MTRAHCLSPLSLLVGLTLACAASAAFSGADVAPFTAQSPLSQLDPRHNGGVLPRNIKLAAFDPYLTDFTCVYGARKLPEPTAQANALFEEGIRLNRVTDPQGYLSKRDQDQALQVWRQASELGDWRATLMLAEVLVWRTGSLETIRANEETAVRLIEQAMQQGVPDAFYLMGEFYQSGRGVKPNDDRAFAYYQLAADMGSAQAQVVIGAQLVNKTDYPDPGNEALIARTKAVGEKMLKCSHAQEPRPPVY